MTTLFSKKIKTIGELTIRPINLADDASFIYEWVTQPYAEYWGMQHYSKEEFLECYEALLSPEHYNAYIGERNGIPVFLVEQYDPAYDLLNEHIHIQKGDTGMHILLAPPVEYIPGFSWFVFRTVMEFLFSDSGTKRVVVEPDVRNDKIHKLNKKAGFIYKKHISFPHKTAWLAICNRFDFEAALQSINDLETAEYLPSSLAWNKVNRNLIRKAISETAHELILEPELVEEHTFGSQYRLQVADGVSYYFDAIIRSLEHWDVDSLSISRIENGRETKLDALRFIQEFQHELAIPDEFLPTYLEEITNTLQSKAYLSEHEKFSVSELVDRDFQEIEHAMTEGHPCFIANSGRIGFGNSDFFNYSPEASESFRLVWLAAHKDFTTFTAVSESYVDFIKRELSEEDLAAFSRQLHDRGLEENEFWYIPVHPWQWDNKISRIYTPDLCSGRLIYLGESSDQYSPQQSIRTLFNTSDSKKHYVKTALSILNMGFLRGLSAHYMKSTPAITQWITDYLQADPELKLCGFQMLDELATIGYESEVYAPLGYRHPNNKMLAALWRQSPAEKLKPGQKAFTMASLLHLDTNNQSFLMQLIQRSGKSADEWIEAYLNVYLRPLIHCLYQYHLVFMPHGENCLLVVEEGLPVGLLMKDITEEIMLFDEELPLNASVERVRTKASDEMQVLAIYTDVFDCFFRFLTAILEAHGAYPSTLFWNKVSECILNYQKAHPELDSEFKRLDLFREVFKRVCLNRLQLSNTKNMLDLSNPIESLKAEGFLLNPLYAAITETV